MDDTVRIRISLGSASGSSAAAAPVAISASVLGQLEKLGPLRDAGVVPSDEFEVKKSELLARL
jgi:hypothetical protein